MVVCAPKVWTADHSTVAQVLLDLSLAQSALGRMDEAAATKARADAIFTKLGWNDSKPH